MRYSHLGPPAPVAAGECQACGAGAVERRWQQEGGRRRPQAVVGVAAAGGAQLWLPGWLRGQTLGCWVGMPPPAPPRRGQARAWVQPPGAVAQVALPGGGSRCSWVGLGRGGPCHRHRCHRDGDAAAVVVAAAAAAAAALALEGEDRPQGHCCGKHQPHSHNQQQLGSLGALGRGWGIQEGALGRHVVGEVGVVPSAQERHCCCRCDDGEPMEGYGRLLPGGGGALWGYAEAPSRGLHQGVWDGWEG